MANYLASDTDLTAVANAIRTKGGTSAQMEFPNGFVNAVNAIPTGGSPTGTKQITITENGTTTEDVANYANAEITVNVSGGGGDLPALLDKIDAGELTIQADTDTITVSHTLGKVPDFACIYQDLTDWADVSLGHCVISTFIRFPYANSNDTQNAYLQAFRYKHATSGNSLGSATMMSKNNATATTFAFARGNNSWASLDANGNPVTYKWMVGTFKQA